MSFGADIKLSEDITIGIEGELGLISGDKSMSMSLPNDLGSLSVSSDSKNNVSTTGTFLNSTESIGANNTQKFDSEISIPIGPLGINLKANTKEIKKRMSSKAYIESMKQINNSYNVTRQNKFRLFRGEPGKDYFY